MAAHRDSGIDSLRTLLIACVVLGHYTPFLTFEGQPYRFLWIAIDQSLRFVVPAFFVLSGYCYMGSLRRADRPWPVFLAYARRILTYYAFWNVFYLLVPTEPGLLARQGYLGAVSELFHRTITNPQILIFEGFREHLWFLVSLLMCLFLVTLLVTGGWKRMMLPLGLGLYGVGLALGAWVDTPLGYASEFNERNGPVFGMVFVAIGALLHGRERMPSLAVALVLTALGFVLSISEGLLLQRWFGTYPHHDFLLSTLLWGPAVALIPLARPGLGRGTFLARLGPLAVGIYLCHLVYVDLARASGQVIHHWAFELAAPAMAFGFAVGTVLLMRRSPLLRRFVA